MDTNKKINVIEDLSRYEDYLTVGRLKKFLENNPDLPDDALVLTQRVEDVYYEENGWGVVLKEGYPYQLTIDESTNDLQSVGNGTLPNKSRTGPFAESVEGVGPDNIKAKLNRFKLTPIGPNYLKNLVEYTGKKLEAGSKSSPFKVYNTQYSKDKPKEGLVSESNKMTIERKRRIFDKDIQNYIQIDFNLNDYTVEKNDAC